MFGVATAPCFMTNDCLVMQADMSRVEVIGATGGPPTLPANGRAHCTVSLVLFRQ